MIRTLQDLVVLSELEAAAKPYLENEILLRTPGCSAEELADLYTQLPGLPASYLRVAARLRLERVSIGYLNLAPDLGHEGRLLDHLLEANSSRAPLWDFIDQHRLYHVADYEGDMICVVRETKANAGQVFRIDLSCPPTPELHSVVRSFEQMIIGFGRVREQFLEGRLGSAAIAEVLDSVRIDFELDDEQMEDWTWFAEVALGEDDGTPDLDLVDVGFRQQLTIDTAWPTKKNDELAADISCEVVRPRPKGHDSYAAVPYWPNWELDEWVFGGCLSRAYWTNHEGRIYKLVQTSSAIDPNSRKIVFQLTPKIELEMVEGKPNRHAWNWTLRELASYELPNVGVGIEAIHEIAAFRRRLPELLTEVSRRRR